MSEDKKHEKEDEPKHRPQPDAPKPNEPTDAPPTDPGEVNNPGRGGG